VFRRSVFWPTGKEGRSEVTRTVRSFISPVRSRGLSLSSIGASEVD
jgi:hypothetical protein